MAQSASFDRVPSHNRCRLWRRRERSTGSSVLMMHAAGRGAAGRGAAGRGAAGRGAAGRGAAGRRAADRGAAYTAVNFQKQMNKNVRSLVS